MATPEQLADDGWYSAMVVKGGFLLLRTSLPYWEHEIGVGGFLLSVPAYFLLNDFI